MKLKAGVIGVGIFGSMHARTYYEMDSVDLVAVADLNPHALKEMESRYNVKTYQDYRILLEEQQLNLISVCTPDGLHLEPVLAALFSGVHVLVEKPLAKTLDDCDVMIQSAKESKSKLMVGQILRFDPRYHAAREAVISGKIGEPVHIYTRRNNLLSSAIRMGKNSSVLFFLGIHDIDFINWCMGCKMERAYAESVSKKLKDENIDDSYMALIKYENGAIASLEVSWILPKTFAKRLDAVVEIMGTEGTLFIDGSGQAVEIYSDTESECPDVMYTPELYGMKTGILRDEINHFVDCIKYDKNPAVTGEDGRAAVEVVRALEESIKYRQPIGL
ncbi:hypothetical protein GF312_04455 [Candidatus Poribacteria bacterium]|nr:hypothetical protein [Candidatus Poribacteria bacterium]